jgi:hypothetical protein
VQILHAYGVQILHEGKRLSEKNVIRPEGRFCIPAKGQDLHSGEREKNAFRPGGKSCIPARMQNLHAGKGEMKCKVQKCV